MAQKPSMKILVIDDSNAVRRTAAALLTREGYDVVTAADGFEALAKVVHQRPDLVFVDAVMPRLDGYQTCALIKRHPQYQNTPVIMLSSKKSLFDRARGRVVGADQYLAKPFSRESLLGAIRQHTNEA